MNKDKMFLLLAVVAVLIFGIPATLHANGDIYIGADIGRAWPDGDIKYTIGESNSGSTNADSGFLFGFSPVGLANIFGSPVRAEFEYFYRKHNISSQISNQSSVKFDDLRAYNGFINIYIDMEPEMSEKWSWYLGGGVGLTYIKTQAETRTMIPQTDPTIIQVGNIDVNDFTSGYQLLLGVDREIPGYEDWSLGLKARYVRNNQSLSELLGASGVKISDLDFCGLSLNLKYSPSKNSD